MVRVSGSGMGSGEGDGSSAGGVVVPGEVPEPGGVVESGGVDVDGVSCWPSGAGVVGVLGSEVIGGSIDCIIRPIRGCQVSNRVGFSDRLQSR
jgi:hypothetical protein